MPRISRLLATAGTAALACGSLAMYTPSRATPPLTWSGSAPVAAAHADDAVRLAVSAFGRSGKLRAVVTDPNRRLELPLEWAGADPFEAAYTWAPHVGTQVRLLGGGGALHGGLVAPSTAGVWRLHLRGSTWAQEMGDLAVITRVPFSEKRGGFLNGYRIGEYATESDGRTDRYAPPAGFIEVTRENQDLYVSEHFRLRNFLTKDQFAVWPKYLALDLRLIDKLELVIQELNAMGVRAEHVAVMSGFRTPAYNGPGEGGRARLSRHTYGDASDVWVDNDQDGWMDDLNGDGRRDTDDVRVMLRAVDRVENRHPELIGGAGVYDGNGAHGPFIHIDARGYTARW